MNYDRLDNQIKCGFKLHHCVSLKQHKMHFDPIKRGLLLQTAAAQENKVAGRDLLKTQERNEDKRKSDSIDVASCQQTTHSWSVGLWDTFFRLP